MLLEIVVGLAGVLFLCIAFNVALNFIHQHRVNQFFKVHSPGLPLADEYTSLYGGHANTIIFNLYNCRVIRELHEKYGETFGMSFSKIPLISTVDLDLIKQILIDEPHDNLDRPFPNIPVEEFEVDCIMFAEGKQWSRLRQASAAAFTNHKIRAPNVMNELEEMTERFIFSLEQKLDAAKKEGRDYIVQDVDDIFHRFSLAVVFKSFYKQDKLVDFHSKKDAHVEGIDRFSRSAVNPLLVMSVVFPTLKPILQWLVMHFHPQGVVRRNIMEFIRQQTKQNLEARNEFASAKKNAEGSFDPDNYYLKDGSKFSRNLSDHFIDQFHDGKITHREYLHTAFFTFFAANKTSATCLSTLICYLANHIEIQEKLRESVLANGTESEYLTWCINEALRLHPPVPLGSTRMIRREFLTKAGFKIPANVFFHTPVFTIHRLKEYWGADANEFRPERWTKAKDFHPCQFLAFGEGKRFCLGKNFAMLKIKMLMNVLMRKFRFELSAKSRENNEFQAPGFMYTVFDLPHFIKISLA